MKIFKKLSLRTKLWLSLGSVAIVLLVSSIISVMEYRNMSSYVSDMVADNIRSINLAQRLSDAVNDYNLAVLSVVGDDSSVNIPSFDHKAFTATCDSLRAAVSTKEIIPLADSVEYSYAAYMLTSLELQDVILSDFIDTRSWFFERLQPRYRRLCRDINELTDSIYKDLEQNSVTFQSTYYRSIIPGIVTVAVGLLLIVLLMFFLTVYYVKPICKMLDSLVMYRSNNLPYNCDFAGDDELQELNTNISEVAGENRLLRKRISAMKGHSKETADE